MTETVVDFDIGPHIGRLALRAVPGYPVTWALPEVPGWTPVAPAFEVQLRDGAVPTFPLVETVVAGEPEPVWMATLTAVQTTALRFGSACRLIDSDAVIAAGPLRVLSGWRGEEPVTLEARVIAGPPGADGTGTGGGGVSDHGALTGLTDDDHQLYALTDGTRGDFAPTSHGHVLADVSDYTAPDLSGLVQTTDARLSDARTPTAHDHDDRYPTEAEVVAALAGKSDDGHTHGQYVENTDARLSDARTPTAHGHPIAGVTGLQTALDGKQSAGSYAPALGTDDNYVTDAEKTALHGHTNKAALDQVSGTNTGDQTLATLGAAPVSHTHTTAQVTGLDAALTGKAAASGQAPVNALTPAGTVNVPASHSMHTLTMTANTTLTFASPTAGHVFALRLSGAFTPTFPASVAWAGSSAPTYASGSVYTFATFDAGATWTGAKL